MGVGDNLDHWREPDLDHGGIGQLGARQRADEPPMADHQGLAVIGVGRHGLVEDALFR